MPKTNALRIAVLGTGNIGSTFAFQLARTGQHDVTVIARPGSTRLQQLQRDNGITNHRSEHAGLRVAAALDEQQAYDVVIVTVLAHQVAAVLPALQRSAAKCVLFMFNTFDPEQLQAAVGEQRCAFGMPFVQAHVNEAGTLKATIGAGGQRSRLSQQRWVDVFIAAGLPAVLEPDMPLWLRCHSPLCVAFESVSVLAMRRNKGASWRQAMLMARGVHECFSLIQGLGYRLYPSSKKWLAACPAGVLASVLWLLSKNVRFRELLAGGVDECHALIGVMIAAAPQASVPVNVAAIQAMSPAP